MGNSKSKGGEASTGCLAPELTGWDAFLSKMKKEGMSEAAIKSFKSNYDQLVSGATGEVPESDIAPVEALPVLSSLRGEWHEEEIKTLLSQTAMLKLNGGLGTSMGLEKAKSLLVVKDSKTFLDIIAEQVKHQRKKFGAKLTFLFMNSFSTSQDTLNHLRKKHPDLVGEPDLELMQSKVPKVDAETLDPASYAENRSMEWCPPGHGDLYASLLGSGMLSKLRQKGIKYLFVSNSDNLGASLDVDLLRHVAKSGKAFVMEVAERTEADKKGGHLCVRKTDGRLMLRESAMCRPEDVADFQNVSKHRFFNTNSIWINLDALSDTLKKHGGLLPLPMIRNAKTVNPRDSKSAKVYQLETAMGSAIECFDNAGAVVVPRSRFLPVKTCNDLLALRSDAYRLEEDATFTVYKSVLCMQLVASAVPLVSLDDKFYKKIDQFEKHIPTVPSMKDCVSLTVKGKCIFKQPGLVVSGRVELVNEGDEGKEVTEESLKSGITSFLFQRTKSVKL